ncbi:MAG: 50S ribosomal protein L44e [Crenarchaeota archaeon]|nr:50S ribosomal protein L44e [Thermoproteota archaeon]
MRIPKVIVTYCPRCKTHTKHSVSIYSHGKRRSLAAGERRYRAKQKGYGSSRKPKQKRFAKVTKKVVLKLKCQKCGYTLMRRGIRMKKYELVEK